MQKILLIYLLVGQIIFSVNAYNQKRSFVTIESLNRGERIFLSSQRTKENYKRIHPVLEQAREILDIDISGIGLITIDKLDELLIDCINVKTNEWETIELAELIENSKEYTDQSNPEITIYLDENALDLASLPRELAIGHRIFKLFRLLVPTSYGNKALIRYETNFIA